MVFIEFLNILKYCILEDINQIIQIYFWSFEYQRFQFLDIISNNYINVKSNRVNKLGLTIIDELLPTKRSLGVSHTKSVLRFTDC